MEHATHDDTAQVPDSGLSENMRERVCVICGAIVTVQAGDGCGLCGASTFALRPTDKAAAR